MILFFFCYAHQRIWSTLMEKWLCNRILWFVLFFIWDFMLLLDQIHSWLYKFEWLSAIHFWISLSKKKWWINPLTHGCITRICAQIECVILLEKNIKVNICFLVKSVDRVGLYSFSAKLMQNEKNRALFKLLRSENERKSNW